ncbi:hypothetical protein ACIOUE_10395 [Streptomyces xanthochromogenes]|uniref:hypothetical protein n=1 Tax=Streptomyces xanthochromogenes TaxID=67384 RepID=UPI00380C7C2A
MRSLIKHRIIRLTSTAAALPSGAYVELQLLHTYGVPLLLALPCGVAVGVGVGRLAESVADAFSTTIYRCPDVGCTYKVRLARVDAGERRRWQEAAASHPGHELNPRY